MGAPGLLVEHKKILELQDCLEILYGRATGVTKADVKLKGLRWDLVLGWLKLRKGRRSQKFGEGWKGMVDNGRRCLDKQ